MEGKGKVLVLMIWGMGMVLMKGNSASADE